MRGHVDLRLTDGEDFGGRFGRASCSAKDGANAGDEFANAERLGYVVISASVEPADLVDLLPPRREDDDRDKRIEAAEFFADLEAVGVGEHQIEQDGFGFFLLGELYATVSSACRDDGKPFELERIREAEDDVRFVFDDEDFFLGRHLSGPVLPQKRTGPEEGPAAICQGRRGRRPCLGDESAAGVTRAGDEERRARLRFAFADEADDALLVVGALGDDFRIPRGRRGRRIDVAPAVDGGLTNERRIVQVGLTSFALGTGRLRDLAVAVPTGFCGEFVAFGFLLGRFVFGLDGRTRGACAVVASAHRVARFDDQARHVAVAIGDERTGQALTTKSVLQTIDDGADGGTVTEVRCVFALVAKLGRTNGSDDAL